MPLRPQSDLHGYASRPAEFLLGNVVDKPKVCDVIACLCDIFASIELLLISSSAIAWKIILVHRAND
ncbi:hypothetical protein [Mesorhizobium sp. WSM2561]|uniref:hypothetical protein n=1 Tax=Mesorhizobium sp. WSM2561 TaxID=1040985 RepID=UPI0004803D3E|nr:hypothetical protein [Mesorhizobium sp. WSM2561]